MKKIRTKEDLEKLGIKPKYVSRQRKKPPSDAQVLLSYISDLCKKSFDGFLLLKEYKKKDRMQIISNLKYMCREYGLEESKNIYSFLILNWKRIYKSNIDDNLIIPSIPNFFILFKLKDYLESLGYFDKDEELDDSDFQDTFEEFWS